MMRHVILRMAAASSEASEDASAADGNGVLMNASLNDSSFDNR